MTAPFNAFVQMENVDKGQLVGPASQLATLVGTDRFWVQVSIPMDKLDYVKMPKGKEPGSSAKVIVQTGRQRLERSGYVMRLLGDLDPVGRLARLLVVIDDPFELKKPEAERTKIPLLLGSYVRVEIDGVELSDVAEVPRRALQENDKVYVLDGEDTLRIKPVEIVWGADETVLVRGPLKDGERLVVSNMAAPVEGMKLRVAQPQAEASAQKKEP